MTVLQNTEDAPSPAPGTSNVQRGICVIGFLIPFAYLFLFLRYDIMGRGIYVIYLEIILAFLYKVLLICKTETGPRKYVRILLWLAAGFPLYILALLLFMVWGVLAWGLQMAPDMH